MGIFLVSFLIYFPYLFPILKNTDIQPFYFLASFFTVLIYACRPICFRLHSFVYIFFFSPILLSLFSFAFCDSGFFYPFKQLFGYISCFILFLCGLFVYIYQPTLLFKFLTLQLPFLNFLALSISASPLYGFFSNFVSRGLVNEARGFTSFAAEPSFVPSAMLIQFLTYHFVVPSSHKPKSFYKLLVYLSFILPAVLSFSGQLFVVLIILLFSYLLSLLIRFLVSISTSRLKLTSFRFLFVSLALSPFIAFILPLFNASGKRFFSILSLVFSGNFLLLADKNIIFRSTAPLYQVSVLFNRPFDFCPVKLFSSKFVESGISALSVVNQDVHQMQQFIFGYTPLPTYVTRNLYSIIGNHIVDFSLLGLFLVLVFYSTFIVPFLVYDKLDPFLLALFAIPMINLSLSFPPFWFLTGLLFARILVEPSLRFPFKGSFLTSPSKAISAL